MGAKVASRVQPSSPSCSTAWRLGHLPEGVPLQAPAIGQETQGRALSLGSQGLQSPSLHCGVKEQELQWVKTGLDHFTFPRRVLP